MEKIQSAEFDERLKSSQYVIIDFSSPGCAPCKKVPPLLEEVLAGLSDTDISAYEVDITESMDIAQRFFILGVPSILIFKDGQEIQRFNSLPKKEKIIKAIK